MTMNPLRRLLGRLCFALVLAGVLMGGLAPIAAADDPQPTPYWKDQSFWAHWLFALQATPAPAPVPPQPTVTWEELRPAYVALDGNHGSSNPTSVPVLDDDLGIVAPVWPGQLGLHQAHWFSRGARQRIAVLDSGFNLRHPRLAGRISWLRYDAIDEDGDPQDDGNGIDDDRDGRVDGGVGHGTFVIGLILDVAPDAEIVPIRIRDDEGWGTDLELMRGLEHALRIGVDIVNLSGESLRGMSEPVRQLIRQLRDQGTLVVVAAGNDGLDRVSELGRDGTALVVGSVDADGNVASFSNYTWEASCRMVFAPGVDLRGPYGVQYDESYATWSGTSFSAALVSGAAALVRSFEPWMQPEDVMNRLQWNAEFVVAADGAPLPFGRVHVGRAVLP